MLPKESSALFGSGAAGDIWRSMLADQLASEIGNEVDLGSARRQTISAHPDAHSGAPDGRMRNET
jgi:peptidoglycan hydrolase FlgJ